MARITTWLRRKDVLAERDESIPSNTGLESCLRKWLPLGLLASVDERGFVRLVQNRDRRKGFPGESILR